MDNQKFIDKCKKIIMSKHPQVVSLDEIFVVWSCKTLQNNKAILSMTYPGAPLVEMTHNGDKGEIYVDTYKKESNECIKV